MRFVPIKNIEQQSVLPLHRVRQGFVKARTAQASQTRGLPQQAQKHSRHRPDHCQCVGRQRWQRKEFRRRADSLQAWLGLVPKQHSSGGKPTWLGIRKRGDSYRRTLLIHQARPMISRTKQKAAESSWLHKLVERRHPNVAAVALLANPTDQAERVRSGLVQGVLAAHSGAHIEARLAPRHAARMSMRTSTLSSTTRMVCRAAVTRPPAANRAVRATRAAARVGCAR